MKPHAKHPTRLRRARPLLVAGAAISAIAAIGCPGPFGNLRAPDCDAGQCTPPPADMAMPDMPLGNLRAPDMGGTDHD